MAEAPLHPCHLLELSNELLMLIATAIYEQHDLRNFSNTCHALHRLADPILYRSVILRNISSCDSFSQIILRYPVRAWEVLSLNINILCYNEDPEDLDGTFISLLKRLRDLNIRFPGLPEGVQGIVVKDIGRHQRILSLHSLRTCTLDLTQTDCGMWPLSIAKPLFHHPTLQSLTLHFASFQDEPDLFKDVPTASTGLEELNLLSCNIGKESLAEILRLPRCLKQFTLGTPFSYSTWEWGSSSSEYISEMYPVYDTLECCRLIAAPALRATWARGPAMGLENFTALKYLEIPGTSLVEPSEIYMARQRPAPAPAYRLRLPPKLEVLKVSPKAWTHQLDKVLAEKAEVPSFRRLVLSVVAEEEAVSELRSSCENSGVDLVVVHESPHVSFHGPPVWMIPE